MLEGIKRVFSGKDVLERQISLFSVCGIAGLINGYFALNSQSMGEMSIALKFVLTALLVIFALFFTGYEIIFLKERQLPEIDMRSFKIAFNKIPFIVFLIGVPILITSLFTKYSILVFCAEALLTIPMTMAQAGFSYNYDNQDFNLLFKNFKLKDYFVLLLKWLLVLCICYLITLFVIFVIFLFAGIVLIVKYHADSNAIALLIMSNQIAISKLANYLTGIILIYLLSIGSLAWDYEVIKTYEK